MILVTGYTHYILPQLKAGDHVSSFNQDVGYVSVLLSFMVIVSFVIIRDIY